MVLDSRQRLPPESRLARGAGTIRTIVVSTRPARPELQAAGVQVVSVPDLGEGRPDLAAVVAALRGQGLARLFVEGGGQVAASFLRCDLVDRLEWFRAPLMIGGEGRPAVGALAVRALAEAPRLRRQAVHELGEDLWERYERI